MIDDLKSDKCDVAMFAVGMTPQRVAALRFAAPSGQRHLCRDDQEQPCHHPLGDIDRPGVRVVVQAGTFMELVMAAALKQATMVVIRPPDTRESASWRRARRR